MPRVVIVGDLDTLERRVQAVQANVSASFAALTAAWRTSEWAKAVLGRNAR